MHRTSSFTTVVMLSVLCLSAESPAQWSVDVESGLAVNGYNDVRIPGTTGTDFSLTDDLDSDPAVFWRLRVRRRLGRRHHLSVLVAPLRLEAAGRIHRPIVFAGGSFPAETPLRSLYRFDSYRLTYAYDIVKQEGFRIAAGATAKIRDAEVRLTGDSGEARKTNTGFVPLPSFRGGVGHLCTLPPDSRCRRVGSPAGARGRYPDCPFGKAHPSPPAQSGIPTA